MAFMKSNGVVTSFATYQDLQKIDQRLFETNEGLTEDVVIPILKRSTERILTKIRSTDWWKNYFTLRNNGQITVKTDADIPYPSASKVIASMNDFSDLCVYVALSEYILPKLADFGTEDNAERQKMGYYTQKATDLFGELITSGDWYDFDGSGAITSSEKSPGFFNLKRVR